MIIFFNKYLHHHVTGGKFMHNKKSQKFPRLSLLRVRCLFQIFCSSLFFIMKFFVSQKLVSRPAMPNPNDVLSQKLCHHLKQGHTLNNILLRATH